MGRLFLLRHGETEGNRNRIYRGRWDLPLNEAGKRQAVEAAGALAGVDFTKVYVSPLRRARQTADAIMHNRPDTELEVSPALVDIDYGEWSQRSDDEIARDYPDLRLRWQEKPGTVFFPGGESLDTVRGRIEGFLGSVAAASAAQKGSVLLVSHRVPIKVLLCIVLGLDNSSFWSITVDTASISLVDLDRGSQCLMFVNETCHLKPLADKPTSIDF